MEKIKNEQLTCLKCYKNNVHFVKFSNSKSLRQKDTEREMAFAKRSENKKINPHPFI